MTQTRPATVRHDVVVNAPLERAFRVFTEQFGDFKPREHNLMSVPIAETVFEPRVGGHIYDRGEDGTLCKWATIVAYEPPNRVVFTWNIGPTWQLETDSARCSEVEVRFTAESPDRTRVDLEHRQIERHGEGWEAVAAGVGGDGGWPLYLARYVSLLDTGNAQS
ncbi:MAG TPA: SRPBCC family protein [Mycobacterium sp.]|nr:SRPBCC family protein [Mycobacterium sp.]